MTCLGPFLSLVFALSGSPIFSVQHHDFIGMVSSTGCYCVSANVKIVSASDPKEDERCRSDLKKDADS